MNRAGGPVRRAKSADFREAKMYRSRLHRAIQKDTLFSASKAAALGDEQLLAEAETFWEKHNRKRG